MGSQTVPSGPCGQPHRRAARRRGAAGGEGVADRMARHHSAYDAFVQALRDRGFIEGHNVSFERRYSEGREERQAAFVTELLGMKVDLIVTSSSAAVHAAKQATS